MKLETDGKIRRFEDEELQDACCELAGIPKVTPSVLHHLERLVNAGILNLAQAGKIAIYSVNDERLSAVASYLVRQPHKVNEDCCD